MSSAWHRLRQGAWTGIDWGGNWLEQRPVDPYLVWVDATNRADFGDRTATWTPLLVELTRAHALPALRRQIALLTGKPAASMIRVPTIYQRGLLAGRTRFLTMQVHRDFFQLLEAGELLPYIQRFQIAAPAPAARLTPWPKKPAPSLRQKEKVKVIVAVIDDGLAFAHESCRDAMRYFWNQDDARGSAASGFNYGSEYGPASGSGRLSEWLAQAAVAGRHALDEEAVYAKAELMQLRRRLSHGAATMEMATRDLNHAALVAVQLPTRVTGDTSGNSLGCHLLDALHYVLQRADDIARGQTPAGQQTARLPVVLNLSYGNIAGAHDGSSMLEAAMDEFVQACQSMSPAQPFALVLPGGNSHLARCHAAFALKDAGSSQELAWRVHPDDMTPSFMEIWLPPGHDGAGISVELIAPDASSGRAARMGSAWVWPNASQPCCALVFAARPSLSSKVAATQSGQRRVVLLAIAPTAALSQRPLAPAGIWRVLLRTTAAVQGRIDAWIQRDDSPFGFRRMGRQSYFEDPDYVRFTRTGAVCQSDFESGTEGQAQRAYVKRSGTMNAIATGSSTIAVAAYRASDGKSVPYSASGSDAAPASAPLLAQVSEDSIGHRGVLVAGTHSGTSAAFGGSSIAAPQVAQEMARLLSVTPSLRLAQTQAGPGSRAKLEAWRPSRGLGPVETRGPLVVLAPAPAKQLRLGLGRLARPSGKSRVRRRETP